MTFNIFMGLMGGPTAAAIGGLVFAMLAALAIVLVWRKPVTVPITSSTETREG